MTRRQIANLAGTSAVDPALMGKTRTRDDRYLATHQFWSSVNSMVQCVPSQYGLFFEAPQRHKVK